MDHQHGRGYAEEAAEEDRDAIFPHDDSAWFEPGRASIRRKWVEQPDQPVRVGLPRSERQRGLVRRPVVPRLSCGVQRGAPNGSSSDLLPRTAHDGGGRSIPGPAHRWRRIRDVPSMESSSSAPTHATIGGAFSPPWPPRHPAVSADLGGTFWHPLREHVHRTRLPAMGGAARSVHGGRLPTYL